MSNENEHWCCECYHYEGDTSIGEICDLTGESIYDCRLRNSHSCDKWEECICGPLNWEDVKKIVRIADGMMYPADSLVDIEKRLGIQPYYTEVLKRFKKAKR